MARIRRGDRELTDRDGILASGAGQLGEYARTQPDTVALIDDRPDGTFHQVTYRELNDQVNRIAWSLRRLGLAGRQVAWMGRNSIEVIAFIQAAAKNRCGLVPLNHRMRPDEIVSLLDFGRTEFAWVDAEFAHLLEGVSDRTPVRTVVVFDGPPQSGQMTDKDFLVGSSSEEPPALDSDIVATNMGGFTSGTTGKPKRIVRAPGSSVGVEMHHLDRVWGAEPHVFITSGSISSGASGGYYTLAMKRGDTVVLQRKFDAEDWMRLVDRYRVTVAYLSPTVARQICALPDEIKRRYDLSSIRTVFAGAAKWTYALKLAYRETFPEGTLWEIYGSSELGSNTVMPPDGHWGRPESCGRPIEGIDVVLRDEDDQFITKPYERGVLYVRSEFTDGFAGYEGDPEATAATVWGDYRTVGDIAYFDDDGYYYICDRAKDMIVTGGINVFPQEVEAVLDSCPGVLECAVFGTPDDTWGESVHAVVVSVNGSDLEPEAIISFCREHLASHKVPRTIEFLDELPHNLSGKVLKRELRAKYWEGTGRLI
jgi:fatty-acyl-CoA synthase/long-chain acyl-CoA synthetase